jgi:hypothetical protein
MVDRSVAVNRPSDTRLPWPEPHRSAVRPARLGVSSEAGGGIALLSADLQQRRLKDGLLKDVLVCLSQGRLCSPLVA